MSSPCVECDAPRCNARSYVTVTLDNGLPLYWCGHHFQAHDEALWPYVVSMDDRRHELHRRVESSANV